MKQVLTIVIFGLILFAIPWQFQFVNQELINSEENKALASQQHSKELHSISEIESTFQLADVGYYPEIINDPLNALDYNGKRKVAANIGVYLANFMYAKNTSTRENSYDFYAAIRELSNSTDINLDINEIMFERYENDNNSAEEMEALLRAAINNSPTDLSDIQQDQLFAYLVAGNYIEKLHLTSSLIMQPMPTDLPVETEAELKRNLMKYVSNQSEELRNILELFPNYLTDEKDDLARMEIEKLITSYENLETKRTAILSLPANEIFETEEIKDVYNQIKNIRKKIIA